MALPWWLQTDPLSQLLVPPLGPSVSEAFLRSIPSYWQQWIVLYWAQTSLPRMDSSSTSAVVAFFVFPKRAVLSCRLFHLWRLPRLGLSVAFAAYINLADTPLIVF